MKMIVEGIMGGDLPWSLVFIGVFIAIGIEIVGVPVMPFAVGLYLPVQLNACIMIGGIINLLMNRRKNVDQKTKDAQLNDGTLYCAGMIAGATLIGRLLIAFVFPLKQPRKAMVFMAVFCTAFYFAMMQTHSQLPAILLLFAFAFSMAGMNPTAVASAGKMTTVTSMGIMLPVASSGAILMPWVIGKVAESAGLAVGMATNIVPCVGLIVFAILVSRMREE